MRKIDKALAISLGLKTGVIKMDKKQTKNNLAFTSIEKVHIELS